jgi:diguanylate cyclase (GGDEF)-like protein
MNKTIFPTLARQLKELPSSRQNLIITLLIVSLGVVDFATGLEFQFSFFYLIPVGLAAWFGHGVFCFFTAALAAVVGQIANDLAGESHSSLLVPIWNDLMQLLVFLTVAYLLRNVRVLLTNAKRMAQQDFLTGLLNRRALVQRLQSELARASRSQVGLVVGFIDLDHFKAVNDELGHSEGDRLLYAVSRTLTDVLRRSDIVARVGGDEFVVVLPDSDAKTGHTVGQKIVDALNALSARNNWPVTASVGLLYLSKPRAFEDVSQILEAADNLMYEVKSSGRNHYSLRSWV